MTSKISSMATCPLCNKDSALWCSQKDWEYFTSEEYYNYYKCDLCELIFIHPIPSSDQLQKIYPANYYSFNTANKNIVFKIKEQLDKRLFRRVVNKISGKELKILDIGGGTGWILDIVKGVDPRITKTSIVDINPECAHKAILKGHQYFCGRIEDFESTEKFDLIIMLNLLEHVENPIRVMENISNLLTSKGVVLLKTPNYKSWDFYLFRNSYWGGLHCPRHWNIFSKKSFNKIIMNLPLKLTNLKYTQGAPFWAYSMLVKFNPKKISSQKRPLITHPLFPILSAMFALLDFARGIFMPTSQMFITLSKKEK